MGHNFVDLWHNDGPAYGSNGTLYEEALFLQNSLKVIANHDAQDVDHPLFLFHSFHIVHTPLQVPIEWENKFSYYRNPDRRKYAAMVQYMDHAVGKMVSLMRKKNMWANTLFIISSDNGGPIYGAPGFIKAPGPGSSKHGTYGAANNLPLRYVFLFTFGILVQYLWITNCF